MAGQGDGTASSARPSVLVVGAGALGTLYGARLACVADVQLLCRKPHAEAIRRRGGVVVRDDAGESVARLRAEWRPEEIAQAEIVVVLTKVHDTAHALSTVAHVRHGVRVAVSLQNGGDKDRYLVQWCGPERVIGGSSMVGATLEDPGLVRHTLPGVTYFGEPLGGMSARVREIAGLFESAGLTAVATQDIVSVEWSKLVHAAPVMTLAGLTGLPLHELFTDERLMTIYTRLVREAATVAEAVGIELGDYSGMFPVRSIASKPYPDALALVAECGARLAVQGYRSITLSMLEDLRRGRPLELDAVHGFLVEQASRHGIGVPLTALSLELLNTTQVAPR